MTVDALLGSAAGALLICFLAALWWIPDHHETATLTRRHPSRLARGGLAGPVFARDGKDTGPAATSLVVA